MTSKFRLFAAVLMVSSVSAAPALADIIRCEAKRYGERYCPADTRGGVRLINQLAGDCYQGQTWGYDDRGIWVRNGCRAEFETNYDYNRKKNNSGAAAAVVVGALLGAAILANRNNDKKTSTVTPQQAERACLEAGADHYGVNVRDVRTSQATDQGYGAYSVLITSRGRSASCSVGSDGNVRGINDRGRY